jgi:hypothetical protein
MRGAFGTARALRSADRLAVRPQASPSGGSVSDDLGMAKTAAERRAARKRKEHHRGTRRPEERAQPSDQDRAQLVRELIAHVLYTDDEAELDRAAAVLTALDLTVDEDGLVAGLLIALLRGLYERGWQPADVAHVVRRSTTQRITRLATAAIAAEARAAGAADRAPEEWTAQLAALDALSSPSPAFISAWQRAVGLVPLLAWREVLRLFVGLTGLGELQMLGPPPSRWGTHRRPSTSAHSTADSRMLARIRALLAKAESTEFPEEAEALTAKAQQLITRHAVDVALLDARHGVSAGGQVRSRRLHLDNPYPEAKVRLANAVADVNGVRAVWLERLGMVTLVGIPADMDSVELLYTSLLVQATRAMAAAGRAGTAHTRSPSFRRAFLVSYAVRIGERLTEARESATAAESDRTGTDLVPVLRARSQAVDDAFAALFPETYGVERRSFNASGWYAGRAAADTADLGFRRDQVGR